MDDLEFIRRIIYRDKKAWSEFIDRYSRLIYSFIFRTSKLKGMILRTGEADDLCHEIFLRLADNDFEKLKTYKAKNGCKFATWLRQVTVNYVISYLRKTKQLRSLDEETSDGVSLHELLPSDLRSIHEDLTENELFVELKDCIGRLDADDVKLIELIYYQDATIKELEKIFRLERPVLDMRKSRATSKLRQCLKS